MEESFEKVIADADPSPISSNLPVKIEEDGPPTLREIGGIWTLVMFMNRKRSFYE
jgi:hypothetical protein